MNKQNGVSSFNLVAGQIVYWSAKDVPIERIRTISKAEGIEHNWPNYPAKMALRAALEQVFTAKDLLIRPANKDSLCVVREKQDSVGNIYYSECTFSIDSDYRSKEQSDDMSEEVRQAVQNHVDYFATLCPANRVTSCLRDVIAKHFHGTSLRPRGGLYFVPAGSIEQWSRYADQLMTLGIDVKRIQATNDIETGRAIYLGAVEELRERYRECKMKLAEIENQPSAHGRARRAKLWQKELERCEQAAKAIDNSFADLENQRSVLQTLQQDVAVEEATALLLGFTG